jgi:murein L,D-transpeptidase YcbB/YkuD
MKRVIIMKKLFKSFLKFSVLGLFAFVLLSCSRNLTRVELDKKKSIKNIDATPDTTASVTATTIEIGKLVVIDTQRYSLAGKILSTIKSPYYNQRVNEKTLDFYTANGLQTKWLHENAPGELYYAVLAVLKNASHYGLRSTDYGISQLEERAAIIYKTVPVSTDEIIDLDIHVTAMYFLFTTHLMEGKVRNAGYGKYIWKREAKEYNTFDVALLVETKKADHVMENISKLQPPHEQYTRLQKALEYYRLLEEKTPQNLPVVAVQGKIKPNEKNTAIPLIRRKLSLTDLRVYPMMMDTATCMMDSLLYDQTLADAVKFFQVKHGLEPDGIIGEKTLKFLNQSFQEKADIIALNMERMRWLPEKYGQNYIRVNIPEYKLHVYEDEKEALEMRVIVGAANKATPVFNDELEHIVFSPTWTVPVSIIKEEIIPRLKNNPSYYAEKNYSFYKNEVAIDPANESWDSETINPYQYRIVQQPGPDNSLGLVKFVMPNSMSVYMHDTPNHRLFAKEYRALSHGCVRLSEPARFAEYLLRDQRGWTPERISKAMNESKSMTIHLKKHYDVHIEYQTAWVDGDGLINFREDIYGHDKMQLQQLFPVENSASGYAGLQKKQLGTN